ncbi:Uncharacterised protein [Vibrio cholerae]|nr:Uncharacterised protein [Vibrio cholerae]CSI80213.1 Uncharacterised protein [Vibrio cholerae]
MSTNPFTIKWAGSQTTHHMRALTDIEPRRQNGFAKMIE